VTVASSKVYFVADTREICAWTNFRFGKNRSNAGESLVSAEANGS
jgi:hypothetical protein